jgi:hypothetical protein
VWSFGVVLVELVTYGAKPYQGMSNKEVVSKLEQGYRMPCPSGCPDSLYKIMTDCWKTVRWQGGCGANACSHFSLAVQSPIERPTFEGLVFRLEDFFHSEMQYTEASKVNGEEEEEQ